MMYNCCDANAPASALTLRRRDIPTVEVVMQEHATTHVSRTCKTCGSAFVMLRSKMKRGRGQFCSFACRFPPRTVFECAQCGASRAKSFSMVDGKARLFCSKKCKSLGQAITPEQRILRNVDRSAGPDACWPWTAHRNTAGYGVFQHIERSYGAHRVAWEFANGRTIPDGLVVRHLCHNPPCCNPKHLAIGTDQDNMDDMVKAGRQVLGEAHPRSVLTVETVREMRRLSAEGVSQSQIARTLKVARTTVVNVLLGRTWGHVR